MTNDQTITISREEYQRFLSLENRVITSQNQVAYLEQQLADLKRMIFGAKSERYIPSDPNQPTLFELPVEQAAPQSKQQITFTRTKPENKKQPVRFVLPGHLPRVTEIIEPDGLTPDAKRLNCIITEVLEYEAAKLFVREIVRYNPINKLVFFDYRKSRERAGPDDVLQNYEGYLQTDGYTAYNDLKNKHNIIQLACWAHARRKFEHSLDNNHTLADQALKLIGRLYDIERDAEDAQLTFDQIKELRLEKSIPILEEFKGWMDEKIMEVKPKSAIGLALAYTLKLWPRLIRYVEDGRLKIDNNLIENSIRPIALGRKNYLFAGSHESAQQIAIIYSLVGTCKIRGIEPEGWLKKVLTVIPDWPANQVNKLIPGELQ